jgi:hypothetical protein
MRDESGGARHEIAISCFVISILRRSSALRGPDLGPAIFFISHISHMEKFHVESPPLEITSLLPLPSTPPCPEKPFSSSPGSGNGQVMEAQAAPSSSSSSSSSSTPVDARARARAVSVSVSGVSVSVSWLLGLGTRRSKSVAAAAAQNCSQLSQPQPHSHSRISLVSCIMYLI